MAEKLSVILIGVQPRSIKAAESQVKAALQKRGEWELDFEAYPTFEEGVPRVLMRLDLDFVCLINEVKYSRHNLSIGCGALATRMKVHPARPWLCIADDNLNFLHTIFYHNDVHASLRPISQIAEERCRARAGVVQMG